MTIKCDIENGEGKVVGSIELASYIFGAVVRKDILARVVNYQLAKRRSGNHKTKGISDISGTTRKPFNQKGTGRARQGSLRSPQFRGGAVIFGPVVRSHAFSLQKKVRQMGLCCALSAKMKEGKVKIFEDLQLISGKTKDAIERLKHGSVLMVDGQEVCPGMLRAVAGLARIDLLPCQGLNVYDIMNHEYIYLSRKGVEAVHRRLGVEDEKVISSTGSS